MAVAEPQIWRRLYTPWRHPTSVGVRLTPAVLSWLTFLAGLVLLLSGAVPASAQRLEWLDPLLQPVIVHSSRFVGSVAGALLLLLSQGLSRRVDSAYYLTLGALAAGAAASVLKGLDIEEAVFLIAVALVLRRARGAFTRRAALLDVRFSRSRVAAMIAAGVATVWLGLFATEHAVYVDQPWWWIEFGDVASVPLRASLGAALLLLLYGARHLVVPAPHEAPLPDADELQAAQRVIANQSATFPFLAFLGDKALLFNENRTGFVMYAVSGRTWVALGDPVGPADEVRALLRRFLERCEDFGGTPVFYEVTHDHLHLYVDLGLRFLKLGERAVVDLDSFSLVGPRAARFRQALKRIEKVGGTFRVIDATDVPGYWPQLRRVSDEWLQDKAGAEKKFSMGSFEPAYLARFPLAVIEQAGAIVAFANLWLSPSKEELCVDLMRYGSEAPSGVMEALFVHVFIWGQSQGYHRGVLGMAPLSGFESSPIAPLWSRLGSFLYAHGEGVYHFRGLRAYKEKFNPVWEPRYLAYARRWRLARMLADVAALIAGGYGHIFVKRNTTDVGGRADGDQRHLA